MEPLDHPRAQSADGIGGSRRKRSADISEPLADARWSYGLSNRSVVNRMAAACFETSNVMATSAITVSAASAAIDVPACKPCSCIARRADRRKTMRGMSRAAMPRLACTSCQRGAPRTAFQSVPHSSPHRWMGRRRSTGNASIRLLPVQPCGRHRLPASIEALDRTDIGEGTHVRALSR